MASSSKWLRVAIGLLGTGCGAEGSSAPAAQAQASAETSATAKAPRDGQSEPSLTPASKPDPATAIPAGTRRHLDLLELAHLADVDQDGLFVDFGTPARMKYTVGHWRTGFGKDGNDGGATVTNVGASGQVFLPVEGDAARTFRFRLKPIGTKTLQVYLNGKALPTVRLEASSGYADYDVKAPAGVVRAGENQLLMRFGGTTKVGGEDVAAALDWIRVLPAAYVPPADAEASNAERAALPYYGKLVRDTSAASVTRRALTLRAPATLSYYVEIPKQASLSFRVAQVEATGARAKLSVRPEGGPAAPIFEQALDSQWRDKLVPLKKYAGQVVRLDFALEGTGRVAWADPALVVPEVEVASVQPAKSAIVLLIDTLPAHKLKAFNPRSRVETPVLDTFAKEGTVFVNAQSPENWTKPSVASIFTGLYPMTHGTKRGESRLPADVTTTSEVLQKSGFATATFLANGYVSDKFGFKQGWDHYTNYIRENKGTSAERVFREAGDWIEAHKDERFFVYIQTIDPHVPYDPPAEYLKRYQKRPYKGPVSPRKTPDQLEKAKRVPPKFTLDASDREYLEALYDGEVSYHDEYMGKFIERLKKLGLYDQVLFVVTADHGEEFYEHGSYGHGHSVYQELLHVPLMFRWPNIVPAGQRIEETVGTLDIAPTVLSALGAKIPEEMEAINRMEHIRGRIPALPAVGFSDFLDDKRVVRAGRFKLILSGLNATFFDLQTDAREAHPITPGSRPIALRYCRIMLGQFLGASDLGQWLAPNQRVRSRKPQHENTEIDAKTREGLKALGYAN
jgi:choline-sulfatase